MPGAIPFLPVDCRGLGPGDPLVGIWRATQTTPDFERIFLQAADLIFEGILASRGTDLWRQAFSKDLAWPPWDLYNGLPGIAVFAAAHSAATGRPRGTELALELVERLLESRPEEQRGPSGAAVGLGSAIYSLLKIGQLLDRTDLQLRAIELGSRLSDEHILKNPSFDVVQGCAGSVLILDRLILAAELAAPSALAELRRKLSVAVEHLLEGSRQYGAAERTPDGAALESGFAHGVSGIAAALARAAHHLENPALEEALEGLLSFERELYSPAMQNWSMSKAERSKNPIGWCRGAPGIALARLEMLSLKNIGLTDAVRGDLETALRSTLILQILPFDHVCCGTLGRVETLLSAHDLSGAPEDLTAAKWIALRVLRAAKQRGFLRSGTENPLDPSFFQGSSGMGYTFLRLVFPKSLPAILGLK